MISCSQPGQQSNTNEEKFGSKTECDKSVPFGDIDICLPIIDGMTECYSIPIVREKVDEVKHEGGEILAYYLNNDTYEQVDKFGEITFDDYFQVLVDNKFIDMKIGQSELNNLSKVFENLYNKEDWNSLNKKIKQKQDYLSVGRPVLLESYSVSNKVRTNVILTKYLLDNRESVVLSTLNMIQIKEKLIFLTYYKDYDGERSIKNAKSKNDYIVLKLLDENR